MPTIKSNILKKIGNKWTFGGNIERLIILNGQDLPAKPGSIGRILRKMIGDGTVTKKYSKQGYVMYKKLK